jgi:hypothetical protein
MLSSCGPSEQAFHIIPNILILTTQYHCEQRTSRIGAIANTIGDKLDTSNENEMEVKKQLELMMKLTDARLDTL